MMKKFLRITDRIFFFHFFTKIYQKFLISRVKRYLKNYPFYKKYKYKSQNDEFSKLCEKYLTDKGGIEGNLGNRSFHFYSSFYNEYFQNKKKDIKLIFECGIGSINKEIQSNIAKKGATPGASLRVLQDYFQNALIYAADIDRNVLFKDKRISTYHVDQLNEQSIKDMWNNINKDNFDLIIDDGLHTLKSACTLFNLSFSKLRSKGIYVIEDVHVFYLIELTKKLREFNPIIVSSEKDHNIDDYLFVIEKD